MAKSCGTISDLTICSKNRIALEIFLYPSRHFKHDSGLHRDIPSGVAHYSTLATHRLVLLPRFRPSLRLAHEPPLFRQAHPQLPRKQDYPPQGQGLYPHPPLGLTSLLRLHPPTPLAQVPHDSHCRWCDMAYPLLPIRIEQYLSIAKKRPTRWPLFAFIPHVYLQALQSPHLPNSPRKRFSTRWCKRSRRASRRTPSITSPTKARMRSWRASPRLIPRCCI